MQVSRSVLLLTLVCLFGISACGKKQMIRVASFNVSMESTNYGEPDPMALPKILQSSEHQQVKNIAEVIQRIRPAIILLNEFDYVDDAEQGVKAFVSNYLKQSQNGQAVIDYPHFYYASVNTGQVFPVDLDNDGEIKLPEDSYGWGRYPGHYGMLLLSQFPIEEAGVRSFQNFLWKDMPGALLPMADDKTSYYSAEQLEHFRLSSKSHWDIPIKVNGETLHILASHPTPPVFDGPEDRNGKRNFDEIRLWKDYINNEAYLYNDQNAPSGFNETSYFIVVGDLNASDSGGDSVDGAIHQLLDHPKIEDPQPVSVGAKELWPDESNKHRATHYFGLRLDYVLPSKNLTVLESGVYWPSQNEPEAELVKDRKLGSDHRIVWVDLSL